jgi:hypothetical protein
VPPPVMYHTELIKRQFSEANVMEFLYLLNQVTWQEFYDESDVKTKFSIFMDIFLHCYNTAFPIKAVHARDTIKVIGLLKESIILAKRCGY